MVSAVPRRAGGTGVRAAAGGGRTTEVLGWASVAIGAPLLGRPGTVLRAVGLADGRRSRLAAAGVGARELVSAALLLHPATGPRWVWGRVAGDAMDLAVLGRALRRRGTGGGSGSRRTAAATAAVAAIAAADLGVAVAALVGRQKEGRVEITAATTVGRSPREVYDHWRRLEHLAAFMAHVDAVQTRADGRSHWRVSGPFGRVVEWDAEITEDVPGERLSWRSLDGADVANAGTVRFAAAPKDQGTEVHVRLSYAAPAGRLGEALARWAGEDPRQQLDDDLRRFKQVLETGEVVRSDGAPWGKRARREFPQRPAQPLPPAERAELAGPAPAGGAA